MRGKGHSRVRLRRGFGDHPRLCGEKRFPCNHHRRGTGSPPPMRGKGVPIVIKRLTNGITPAYAGKSPHARGQTCHGQDHPRLCGEKQFRAVPPDGYIGSPPPMRGKVTTVSEKDFSKRITPAYAGKSVQCTHHQAMGWDHPRLCGEKCGVKVLSATERRITPAYAGKSVLLNRK